MSEVSPLISIITCTRNSAVSLQNCLNSVSKQSYKHFEHIFIDTNSYDETIKIIHNYSHTNKTIINFPPIGVYKAFNEGLRQSRGDIIGFLHSDDEFSDKDCLKRIASAFINNKNLGFFCSVMNIYNSSLRILFAKLGAPPHKISLREEIYSMFYFAHPTYYCSKEIINRVGFFNERYKYASDADWLLRLEQLNLSFIFDKQPLVNFRSSGLTAKHSLASFWEESQIKLKYNGLSFRLIFISTWHLTRRFVKYLLMKYKLEKLLFSGRKLIYKIQK